MSQLRELPGGIYPYLPTPIDGRGRIDTAVVHRLVEDLVVDGVHGLTPLGTTGELPYLTVDQRRAMTSAVVESAAGRVPVVVGVSAFSTADAIEQAHDAVTRGADGLVVMRQQALPTPRAGVVEYFARVAAAVDVPVVLYTNPAVLGTDLTIEDLRELVEVPTIRYIKDASGVTGRLVTIVDSLGDRLQVFSASAHVPLLVFEVGGIGWMAGPACVLARHSVALYERWRAGDVEAARRLQRAVWPFNELFQRHGLAACVKAALQVRGYDVGDPLHPQHPCGTDARAEIARCLDAADAALADLEAVSAR